MKNLLKRFSLYAVGATLGLGLLLMPEIAFAVGTGGTNDALKNFSEIASTLVHVISAAAMLMMQFFPPLWGSELITGYQVTEMLRPMWIYVRNLCNIAFVGMILFLALSNMVTSGKGIAEWNIKTKLPKIILGLVAINFSMLAVRVLVDVVHVGTVALLSIADPVIDARGIDNVADYYSRKIDTETFEDCEEGSGGNCKTVRELVNNTFCPSGPAGESCLFRIKKISAIQAEAATMSNPERKNIMLGFGTFFMKLESLPMLSADTGGILDVLDSAIFSLVFGIAYLLALLAIMVVLLMRVVMMWLFTIFSPILVMSWVMGIKVPLLSDQFWVYLLVPVKAAGALAFGFVMISQLELMTIPAEFFVSVIEPGPSLRALWGEDEFGGWRMLWKILTVVLFWKVVFGFALKDLEGMEGIVGGIKSFGEGAGKLALSTAGEIPIPGLKSTTGATNMNDILRSVRPSTMTRMADGMRNNPGTDFAGDYRRAVGGAARDTAMTAQLRRAATSSTEASRFFERSRDDLADFWHNNKAEHERFLEALKRTGPDGIAAAGRLSAGNSSRVDIIRELERVGIGKGGAAPTNDDPIAQPTQETVVTGTATLEGNITIDNREDPIALTQSITAGSTINQATLEAAGVTASIVDGLDATQRAQLATQIATRAGARDQDTEILRIINAIN